MDRTQPLLTNDDGVPSTVALVPKGAALIVGIVTACLLSIWIFAPSVKAFSGPTMKANTCLGLVLASSALWLLSNEDTRRSQLGLWGRGCALAVLLIGAASGLEYLTGWNFGIDELVANDFIEQESRLFPGRMSPIAATCFCLIGGALLVLDVPSVEFHWTSALTIPLLLVCLIALTGYVYTVRDFYQLGPYIRIAWPTASCFFLLGVGVLLARPDRGPIRYFANARLSGVASRQLLPATLFLPLILGWLRLRAQRAGFIGLELGVALFTVGLVVFLCLIVWANTRALDATDRERAKSQAKLAQALRLREDFLSVASHELKTPLTALLLQLQGLQRAARSDPHQEPRLARAVASGMRLEKLIDELLDLSRIREGRLRLEPELFDLAVVIREVASRFTETAERAGSTITVQGSDSLYGHWDRLRIDQVLTNLLSNALKYGAGQPVEVTVGEEGSIAVITVRDHGIGISKEQHQRIFERFERGRESRSYGGFGLGLWIAREIVVLSGGSIGVESAPDEGACFTVRLPINRPNAAVSS